jgi:leucyl aminopeptidase
MLDTFDSKMFFSDDLENATCIHLLHANEYQDFLQTLTEEQRKFLNHYQFDITHDTYSILPNLKEDTFKHSIIMLFQDNNYYDILHKVSALPKLFDILNFVSFKQEFDVQKLAYLWASHFYTFNKYKHHLNDVPKLYIKEVSLAVKNQLRALFIGRNCINMPAEDFTPLKIQEILQDFAKEFNAECHTIIGSELLEHNFNLIHAVGRSIIDSERQPRLIDFNYQTATKENPKTIILVGKGVCFDTGGLNIKTENSMLLMKKDMGGAATVIAVALNLLLQKPDYNLRVIIPAVENNVAGNSFRPGDIFTAYNGKTVEITNTDAEGRLILADALSFAAKQSPDLLIDIATLTGAARVAVGPDLPVLYTNNNQLVSYFTQSKFYNDDPIWQLPLWQPYAKKLKGDISDLINSPTGSMAGSIKAALFLENFIEKTENWIHFDSYCYVPDAKPAHPKGGEVMPFVLLCDMIQKFSQQ